MKELDIRNILSKINDPTTGSCVLDFIKNIIIEDDSGTVIFAIEYDNLQNESDIGKKEALKLNCISALQTLDWVKHVKIAITSTLKQEQKHNTKQKLKLPLVSNIIVVASGKGGVGKSTVSANLAITMMNAGLKVGLLDADIYGPSLTNLFGINKKPSIINEKMEPIKKFGLQLMSIGFLIDKDEAVVWRGPMLSKALHQMMRYTNWSDIDYLIIDTPPGTGDLHLTLSENYIIDGAIVVTTPQQLSTIDAQKGINMFKKLDINVLGVIENMSYFVNDDKKHIYPFGCDGGKILANKNSVKFLGEIPLIPELSKSSDIGKPITYYGGNEIVINTFNNIMDNLCLQR